MLFSDEAAYLNPRVALAAKLVQTVCMFLPTLIVSTALSQGSDSVEWFFFDLETNGEPAEFFSTTPIRPNGETYEFFWTLLSFEIQLTTKRPDSFSLGKIFLATCPLNTLVEMAPWRDQLGALFWN